jgi:hypothetical protein
MAIKCFPTTGIGLLHGRPGDQETGQCSPLLRLPAVRWDGQISRSRAQKAGPPDLPGRVEADDQTMEVDDTMATSLSRRSFLAAAGVAASGVVLGACSGRGTDQTVGPEAGAVDERERQQWRPDAKIREVVLAAGAATIDFGNRTVSTWAYNDALPGPLLRVQAGEVLRARLDNRLPSRPASIGTGSRCATTWTGCPG